MADLVGQEGEIRFVIEVTRKDTGKVEHYDMIGKIVEEDDTPLEPKKEVE